MGGRASTSTKNDAPRLKPLKTRISDLDSTGGQNQQVDSVDDIIKPSEFVSVEELRSFHDFITDERPLVVLSLGTRYTGMNPAKYKIEGKYHIPIGYKAVIKGQGNEIVFMTRQGCSGLHDTPEIQIAYVPRTPASEAVTLFEWNADISEVYGKLLRFLELQGEKNMQIFNHTPWRVFGVTNIELQLDLERASLDNGKPLFDLDASIRVALYDFDPTTIEWPFRRQKPLPLQTGRMFQVLCDDGSGWALGHPLGLPDEKGYFPKNYTVSVDEYSQMLADYEAAENPKHMGFKIEEGDNSKTVEAKTNNASNTSGMEGVVVPMLHVNSQVVQALRLKITSESNKNDEEMAKEIFRKYDTDGNGLMSKQEMINLMESVYPGLEQKDAELIFNAADLDKSDNIDVAELITWIFQDPAPVGGERLSLRQQ